MKPLYVEWRDSVTDDSRWSPTAENFKWSVESADLYMKSLGFLFAEDKHQITLCMNTDCKEEKQLQLIQIPKRSITKRQELHL